MYKLFDGKERTISDVIKDAEECAKDMRKEVSGISYNAGTGKGRAYFEKR